MSEDSRRRRQQPAKFVYGADAGLFIAQPLMRHIAAIAEDTLGSPNISPTLRETLQRVRNRNIFALIEHAAARGLTGNERAMLMQELVDINHERAISDSPNVPLCALLRQLEVQVRHPFTTSAGAITRN